MKLPLQVLAPQLTRPMVGQIQHKLLRLAHSKRQRRSQPVMKQWQLRMAAHQAPSMRHEWLRSKRLLTAATRQQRQQQARQLRKLSPVSVVVVVVVVLVVCRSMLLKLLARQLQRPLRLA